MRAKHRRKEESPDRSKPRRDMAGWGWCGPYRCARVIFWLHLVTGVVAGLVIFVMSATGVLLAFERQIVAFAERDVRTVQPPVSGAPRLDLDTLVARARAAVPEGKLSGVMLRADPTAMVSRQLWS